MNNNLVVALIVAFVMLAVAATTIVTQETYAQRTWQCKACVPASTARGVGWHCETCVAAGWQ